MANIGGNQVRVDAGGNIGTAVEQSNVDHLMRWAEILRPPSPPCNDAAEETLEETQLPIVQIQQLPNFVDKYCCKIRLRFNKRGTVTCATPCASFVELIKHQEREHNLPQTNACIPCELRFMLKKDANLHSLNCPSNHPCPICANRFETKSGLKLHVSKAHNVNLSTAEYKQLHNDRVCPSCNRIFANARGMKQHRSRGKCIPRRINEDEQQPQQQQPQLQSEVDEGPLASPPLEVYASYQIETNSSQKLPKSPMYPHPDTYECLFPHVKQEIPETARRGESTPLDF